MKRPDPSIISFRITNLRESKGWSKAELAKRLGKQAYTTITKWESGQSKPQMDDIINMSILFDVSADYLLGLSDEK